MPDRGLRLLRRLLLRTRLKRASAENGENVGVDIVKTEPRSGQRPCTAAVRLAEYAQKQVLCADIAVTQASSVRGRLFYSLPCVLCKPLRRGAGLACSALTAYGSL